MTISKSLFHALPRRALNAAVLALLASGPAAAGYIWTIPTAGIADTQNGVFDDPNISTNNINSASLFVGINNAGTIAGDFIYSADSGLPSINGLANQSSYGFIGNTLLNYNANNADNNGLLYSPQGNYSSGGVNFANPSDITAQPNSVTAINNNGYFAALYPANPQNASQTVSYISNNPANPASGLAFNDANSYASGDTNTLQINGAVTGGYALGLDSGGNGAFGIAVGFAEANFGGAKKGSAGEVGVLYNNTGATLDGIANGAYGDWNYGGISGAQAVSSRQDHTYFTSVNEHGGDVYVGGYWDPHNANGTLDGLIFNVTANTWTDVQDPLATNGTFVTGLNSQGEAVGYYLDANNLAHGFTYNYLTSAFINASIDYAGTIPGDGGPEQGTYFLGVNDSGVIVGQTSGYNNNFGGWGFVATPATSTVPVPASFWMMLSGLFAGRTLLRKRGR